MKQFHFLSLAALVVAAPLFSSCEDDPEPVVVPPNESGLVEVNGGGATYPNTAYISLRSGVQTAVPRQSWDLAFSTGSDFKVLINGTTGAMASATGATDINAVSAADMSAADSLAITLSTSNLVGILHVDNAANPLSDPAIESISATAADNQVYFLNRGASGLDARPWKKIRIIRNGAGYTLQHANADATTFSSLDIAKNTDQNFIYVSFENGIVDVEPDRSDWDIAWTAGTSSTPYPAATNGTLPYFYQDLVYSNIYNSTSVVQVMEADIPYTDFAETDVPALVFDSTSRLTIGSGWRSGGGPPGTPGPAVRTDRYYIIKDAEGNIYKLLFLSLTKDGERGKPSFEYELVEAGK